MTETKVVYRTGTGEITGVFTASGPMPPQALEGEDEIDGYVEASDGGYAHYVLSGTITPRPEMPVQVVGSVVTAPAGVAYELWFAGEQVSDGVSETGVMDFEIPVAGSYELRLQLFPYFDAKATLSV